VAGGTLSGTITDPSDKFVPQAQISITNIADWNHNDGHDDSDGYYTAANLLLESNRVTVLQRDSRPSKKGISLNGGAQQVINLILQVGRRRYTSWR